MCIIVYFRSPNSQLTIPRYPAFDFSEQEDVHSMFPSPSEPEANRTLRTEDFPGILKSDKTADSDAAQNTLNLKDTNQKKRNSSKSKSLMPEHMENSETESTKGSFECEAPDMPPSCEATSIPVPDIAFPSLPNTFLAKLGVHKDSPLPVEAFDEHDLESKFIALSLAFKTDRATLAKRLELHKRQRDMAEKNVENEFQSMRDHLCKILLSILMKIWIDAVVMLEKICQARQKFAPAIISKTNQCKNVPNPRRKINIKDRIWLGSPLTVIQLVTKASTGNEAADEIPLMVEIEGACSNRILGLYNFVVQSIHLYIFYQTIW
ncbi:hypothetical protein AVEN_192005-1 [Araneus ventricosus]|uniref:Uncharacterized protein n=1 Tax=Araneus ventricosus TaxID=182803 RepID=A0A4Y2B956_ARAVE|nr:hypothetical protein AVEN_192005-1 [Araneus ventricosus]